MTDYELIDLARKRDPVAAEELVKRYKPLVRKIARSYYMISGGDADDIIQEGTIGLLKAVTEYNEDKNASFASFARICITNKIKDAVRTSHNNSNKVINESVPYYAETDDGNELIETVSAQGNPIENYTDEEAAAEFFHKLESLFSSTQLDVLKLYLEGYSYKEISAKTGLGLKNVDNTLARIKNTIRKKYPLK